MDPGRFNYPVAVFPERRGKAFYLCVRCRTKSRGPDDDFIVRGTRITLTGYGRFDLAYFRQTNRWFTVARGVTAVECFKEIDGTRSSGRRHEDERTSLAGLSVPRTVVS